jgi:hypothetical protein
MLTDPKEILEYEQNKRDLTHEELNFSESRIGELSDEFTRLEVQIAAILFAFMGFFVGVFTNLVDKPAPSFSSLGISSVKMIITFVFFFLMLSLSFGLVHIKRKEYFWCDIMVKRANRYLKWESATKKDVSLEQAIEYHEGTMDRGHISSSPTWTWVLQTTSLGIAVLGIFILLMIFLFH